MSRPRDPLASGLQPGVSARREQLADRRQVLHGDHGGTGL